jgi:hypothetical protein
MISHTGSAGAVERFVAIESGVPLVFSLLGMVVPSF